MSNSKKSFVSLSLISSVLASALCAQESVVKQNNTLTLTDINAPTITITTTETNSSHFSWTNPFVPNGKQSSLTGSVQWSDGDGLLSANVTVKDTTPSNNNKMTQFHLYFNNEESSQILIQNGTNNTKDKVVVKGGKLATAIVADFRGKGLDSKFYLNFGDPITNSNQKIARDSAQTTRPSSRSIEVKNLTKLKGDLTIIDGSQQVNTYRVTLQEMEGNLDFYGNSLSSSKGLITFTGSGLVGNIASSIPVGRITNSHQEEDGVNIVFNPSATMQGDIKSYGTGNDSLKKNITFQGNGDVLTGNVISYGSGSGSGTETGSYATGGHHITFEHGNMTGSIISTQGNGQSIKGAMAGSTQRRGYNSITFSGTSQTLTGGILAIAYNNCNNNPHHTPPANFNAKNVINLNANTTLSIKSETNGTVNIEDKGAAIEIVNSDAQGGSTHSAIGTNRSSTIQNRNVTFTVETGSITAKGYGTNEINLLSGSTLVLNNGDGFIKTTTSGTNPFDIGNSDVSNNTGGTNQAKSIINFDGENAKLVGHIATTSGQATINFKSNNNTLNGAFYTSGGTSLINVYAGANATVTGSLSTDSTPITSRRGVSAEARVGSGTNTITLGTSANLTTNAREGDSTQSPTPATASLTLQGGTNTITTLTATAEKSTLIIDGSLNANTTTITTITDGNHLTLNLNGRGPGNGATAKLINNGNALTLKALTLGSGSTHNTLDLTQRTGKTTITDQISVSNGQGVTIKLKGQELELTGGMNTTGGTSTINVTANGASANATLSGGDVSLTNLDLVAGTSANQDAQLTLKNGNTTISTITANTETNGTKTLTLDATASAVTASTSSISGEGLILELKSGNSGSENTATFNINGGTNKISELKFTGTNGNQTFNANGGNTTIATLTLGNNNTINANGGSTTITPAVNLTNSKALNLGIGNGNLTLTAHLTAGNGNDGTANINFTGNGTLTSNLTIGNTTNGTININVASGNGTIAGKLNTNSTTTDSKGINIDFTGSNASLSIIDPTALTRQARSPIAHTISTLTATGEGNILNLSGQARNSGVLPNRTTFQTLKINDLKADSKSINFLVYANPEANNSGSGARADRIIIEGSNGSSRDSGNKTHYLGVIGDPHKIIGKDLYDPSGNNNIALATVKNNANITLEAVTNISGFSLITYEYQKEQTGQDGKVQKSKNNSNDYTTYFLGSAKSLGATEASQEVSASALATNYDLYLANMNSLNKRMGELRDNPHSQGVWARVFNGMQTSSFALQTQAVYTTIQAGYDYAFGSEGANNYVGVALSYANSSTKSKTINELNQTTNTTQTKGIDAVTSNAVEIAVYNSYVQDGASVQSGWSNGLFSDSIVKFSYISSDLTLLDQSNTYNTTNYALTLSQEIGYRFLLGSEGEWNIDPQAEVALGYLNQSNLRQTLSAQNYLDGIQNAIVTLRSRVGASFGYDFKKFTEGKSINAKLYVGAYYVYDYIAGGDVSLTDNFGAKVSLSPLASTGRAVMNVGTNIGVQDNTRIYFDFEKSFGGSITTDYQVNLGVRYSFGESNGYTPAVAKAKEVAPLKVEEVKNTQENQAQESKTTQESK